MNRAAHCVVAIGFLTAAGLFSGCATTATMMDSEDVFISTAKTYDDADGLVISGKVKRGAMNCCDAVRGHVDIVILGAEDEILDAFSTFYSPHNIPKVRTRSARFEVRYPYNFPEKERIRIAYHDGLDGADSAAYAAGFFNCGQNEALPQYSEGNCKDITIKGKPVARGEADDRYVYNSQSDPQGESVQ